MDEKRMGRRFGFLCSQLEDPRRIQLRQGRFLQAYQRRGSADDVIEIAHDLTKLWRTDDPQVAEAVALFQQPYMYPIEYSLDREYPLQPRIGLPEPVLPDDCSFIELVRRRRSRRNFARRQLAPSELGALLFCTLGETGRLTAHIEDGQPIDALLRSIPSGGALHPTRVFVAVLQPGTPPCALYHYDSPDHSLELIKGLRGPEIEQLLAGFPIHPAVVDLTLASAIFFITSKFWRSRAKYGPRGYRYCLQEAGCATQNLGLAAEALGLSHVVLGGFYDDEVHSCLELDGVDHAVIAAVAVGGTSPAQMDGNDAGL